MHAGLLPPHPRPSIPFTLGMKDPRFFRFPPSCPQQPVGAGLANLGNTCFLNAVLQCLTHTVPLVERLRSSNHAFSCAAGGREFCALCQLKRHVENSMRGSGLTISPMEFCLNLKKISSNFEIGGQEDAHEFLHCLLESLHSCSLGPGSGNYVPSLEEDDSLIKQVFGGRIRSQLRCCECGHESNTFEPLLDLSLEINEGDTLMDALDSFTKVEKTDPEIKLTCEGCKARVSMEKQLKLEQAPQVVVLHLKRFKMEGPFIRKIYNFVPFPLELDLQPYLSFPHDEEQFKYDLYAAVVHYGSPARGHYVSVVRSTKHAWHGMDDAKVRRCSLVDVLGLKAYILFYVRQGSSCWFSSLMNDTFLNDRAQILGTDLIPNYWACGEPSGNRFAWDMWEREPNVSTDSSLESTIDEEESDNGSSPVSAGNQDTSSGADHKASPGGLMPEPTRELDYEPLVDTANDNFLEDREERSQSLGRPMQSENQKEGWESVQGTTVDAAVDEAKGGMLSSLRSGFSSYLPPPVHLFYPRSFLVRKSSPKKKPRLDLELKVGNSSSPNTLRETGN